MKEARPDPVAASARDKEAFLERNRLQVRSLLETDEERALLDRCASDSQHLSPVETRALDSIIERFETKLYRREKAAFAPGAKRVLVTSNDPGAWNAVSRLIEALEGDERCRGIVAVVSGSSRTGLTAQFPAFKEVHETPMLLEDALALAEKEPIDVAVASVSSMNGPENLALFAGKGSLGAARTYLMFEGYGALGSGFTRTEQNGMEMIDGILVNDAFARAIVHEQLPEYPLERIHEMGSLAVRAFELEQAAQYRKETRERLGISEDALAVAYIGDTAADYADVPGVDPDVNNRTFEETLGAVRRFAEERVEDIALIVRPHPRDPNKERLLHPSIEEAPANLHIANGSGPISMNQVAYAADAIVSIMSTENFFAPLRGRQGIFLAYDLPGLGNEVLRNAYSPALQAALEGLPNISVVHSPEELEDVLASLKDAPALAAPAVSAESKTLDTILARA